MTVVVAIVVVVLWITAGWFAVTARRKEGWPTRSDRSRVPEFAD